MIYEDSNIIRFKGFIVVFMRTGYVPYSEAFDTYEDALESLKNSMRNVGLLNRAIGCILNHKLEVVYKTEAGIDA